MTKGEMVDIPGRGEGGSILPRGSVAVFKAKICMTEAKISLKPRTLGHLGGRPAAPLAHLVPTAHIHILLNFWDHSKFVQLPLRHVPK